MPGKNDKAQLSDDLAVAVNGKGPDPHAWGQEQTIPAADQAPEPDGVDVKGPDPDAWG